MSMLTPLTRRQKWIAYGSLIFIGVWTLWLLYLIGVYLSGVDCEPMSQVSVMNNVTFPADKHGSAWVRLLYTCRI